MKSKAPQIFACIFLASVFLASHVLAEGTTTQGTGYTLLEPLPLGEGGLVVTKITAGQYISNIFSLVVALAGVLAVLRLIQGGIIYMTTDAFMKKSEAKGIIKETFGGLALVLGAWMIIALISPPKDGGNTFTFDLSLPSIPRKEDTNSPFPTAGGTPMTDAELAADKVVRTKLTGTGIGINAGPCTEGQTRGCTNLNGLPTSTIDYLIQLKSDCGCGVTVTGGTEGGHNTHGPDKAPVDLSYTSSLKSWLISKNYLDPKTQSGTVPVSNGRQMRFFFEAGGVDNSSGDHWHLF